MGASNDPVYLRVLEDLRDQIRGGALAPGARVPSRNGIIARYGVGETAAKHALQVLAAEGLIEARAGSGSYVRRLPVAAPLEHDRVHFPGSPFGLDGGPRAADERADAGSAGHAPRLSWEYQSERVPAPAHVARRLRLPDGDQLVTRTRYLMSADGSPVQLATSYEPAAATAQTPVPFPEQGTFPAGSPVLLIERSHRAGERTVETGEIVIAADRFRLRYRFPVTVQAEPGPATAAPPAAPPDGAHPAGDGQSAAAAAGGAGTRA